MSQIRVSVRHGEAVVRPDQPELWVQGEKISPGEEKGFDLVVGEPFNIEARLTEEMEMARKNREADDRKIEEERRMPKKNQEAEEPKDGSVTAPKPEKAPPPPPKFVSSPAPKVEPPPRQTESRSGVDSKEVKDQAPLKK